MEQATSLGARVAAWASDIPDAPAIEYLGTTLRYADLQRRAARVGSWMRDLGVEPGDIVALDLERSADLVVAMLATWQAGAAFMPLDPAWPLKRCEVILGDARPALLVHRASPRSAALKSTFVRQADLAEVDFDRRSSERAAPAVTLSSLAYVLYTSGSTGTPKGVMIEHAQLLNYAGAASEAMRLWESRRWALLGSLAADLAYTALFGALFNGACVVIAGAEEAVDGDSFASFIRSQRIDALKIVPSHLEALLESAQATVPRKVILGGEATPPSLLLRLKAIAPDCQIFNHYGPTETTVGVMVHEVDSAVDLDTVLPLTRVLSNCRVRVLDENLNSVPIGALGTVFVGGPQVCRGYVSGGNERAFVADPLEPGERLYRTGDLAFRLDGHSIRLAGRADQQLKVRGFRVELGEIEAALSALGPVRQVAVVARQNGGPDPERIAFVVVRSPGSPDSTRERLQAALAETLPAHMLPTRYEFLDGLPRLPNGKVDRLALHAAPGVEPEPATQAVVRDPVERAIASCMAQLLKRPAVGSEDDFLALGGQSLLVIKLVARLRRQLGVEIPPATVFDCGTPAALASAVRAASRDIGELERCAMGQVT